MKLHLTVAILVVLVAPLSVTASKAEADDAITIESASVHEPLVGLKAYTTGKPVELTCVLTDSSCRILKPGKYLMVHAAGPYTDCQNVSLYSVGIMGRRKEVGVYCLLGLEDCGIGECAKVSVPLIISEVPDRIPENSKH